jgi:hypothetical protein
MDIDITERQHTRRGSHDAFGLRDLEAQQFAFSEAVNKLHHVKAVVISKS